MNGRKNIIVILKENCVFGENSFFTSNPRSCNAKSVDSCTFYSWYSFYFKMTMILYKISRTDFLTILEKHNDDYEKFCMMKDQYRSKMW